MHCGFLKMFHGGTAFHNGQVVGSLAIKTEVRAKGVGTATCVDVFSLMLIMVEVGRQCPEMMLQIAVLHHVVHDAVLAVCVAVYGMHAYL